MNVNGQTFLTTQPWNSILSLGRSSAGEVNRRSSSVKIARYCVTMSNRWTRLASTVLLMWWYAAQHIKHGLLQQSKARFPLPELTARVDGWPFSITRQLRRCWRARVSTSRVDGPWSPVNSGSGNRALLMWWYAAQHITHSSLDDNTMDSQVSHLTDPELFQ